MRINHNIAALNTYRQFGAANASQAKSMEKLSSGLRINKAGDDAAGLAISEKMRGQIRGLDMAAKNSQDGVSLIQTAEGALNETHSILQRMRELATQAANDTNTADDRGEIQKEINQLTSEINRIGNTTDFNTKKLLKGGADAITHNVALSGATLTGGADAVTHGATVVTNTQGANATAAKVTATSVIDGTQDISTTTNTDNEVSITVGATTYKIDNAALKSLVDGTVAGTDFVTALENASDGSTGKLSDVANVTFDATTNKLSIEAKTGGATTISVGVAGTDSTAVKAAFGFSGSETNTGTVATKATGVIDITGTPTAGATFTLADKTFELFDSSNGAYSGSNTGIDMNGKTNEQIIDAMVTAGGPTGYTLTKTDADTIKVESNVAGATSLTSVAAKGLDSVATAASGTVTFTDVPTAGATVEIAGKKVEFFDSSNGAYAGSADFSVDINGKTAATIGDAVSALSITGFTLTDDNAGVVTVTSTTAGAAGNSTALAKGTDTTLGDLKLNFQIGANSAQSLEINVTDMRSDALNVSGTVGSATITASNGKVASFTSTLNVTDGTNNVGKEYALDVSSYEKATAAISVLDDAINSVSSERSKLGAYQNRLEHTINNLGTSSENLTAAESRIRDVDYALAA